MKLGEQLLARKQTIIFGVKRGKVPMALRPRAPPQKKVAGTASCTEPMSKMFDCWKNNEYKDGACVKEIEAFLTCANQSIEKFQVSKKEKSTSFSQKDLNDLIAKHTKEVPRGERTKFFPLK